MVKIACGSAGAGRRAGHLARGSTYQCRLRRRAHCAGLLQEPVQEGHHVGAGLLVIWGECAPAQGPAASGGAGGRAGAGAAGQLGSWAAGQLLLPGGQKREEGEGGKGPPGGGSRALPLALQRRAGRWAPCTAPAVFGEGRGARRAAHAAMQRRHAAALRASRAGAACVSSSGGGAVRGLCSLQRAGTAPGKHMGCRPPRPTCAAASTRLSWQALNTSPIGSTATTRPLGPAACSSKARAALRRAHGPPGGQGGQQAGGLAGGLAAAGREARAPAQRSG
jgi:hypothetical protein